MKSFFASLGLLTVIAAAMPNAIVSNQARDTPDGLYVVTVGDDGKPKTDYTPFSEVVKRSPVESSPLERRRNGCGPGSGDRNDIVDAQNCLKDYFSHDTIYLHKNAWTYCIKGNALAFICPYSGGFKYKGDVQGTFDAIDRDCSMSRMGYNQVSGGEGDMTAGRCTKDDHFCTKNFHAGD